MCWDRAGADRQGRGATHPYPFASDGSSVFCAPTGDSTVEADAQGAHAGGGWRHTQRQ
jgi:hypothetical protein